MSSDILSKAAQHWNAVTRRAPPAGTRHWWQSPQIWRHINTVCGVPGHAGQHEGSNRMIAKAAGASLGRGISVGCGTGAKEMRLIRSGIVEHFDLFEISDARISLGRADAKKLGVEHQVTWRSEDAFTANADTQYDIVYWNNSLHHMLDVEHAIKWSLARLRSGGIFAMDDFVGPSRFQWTDLSLTRAAEFRSALPKRLLQHPAGASKYFATTIVRPSIDAMIAMDPTESADSGRIVKILQEHLPGISIVPTGGIIYQLACQDILGNFNEADENDAALLALGLHLDQQYSTLTNTHYAVAVWQKP